jgi:lipoic acid synthetase
VVLGHVAGKDVLAKTSLMLGLGESEQEVEACMKQVRLLGVDILTLGQYMQPTKQHLSIKEWVKPEVFDRLREKALAMGFRGVASGPLVRSSYQAHALYTKAIGR